MAHAEALDEAETLLVSCKFDEAAAVCRSTIDEVLRSVPAASDTAARSSGLRLGDLQVTVTECEEVDLLMAVLLQCGFELGRKDEYRYCHTAYKTLGSMPFTIALLWVRLRLTEGEVDFARHTLECMALALRADSSSSAEYTEVMELLIRQVLLPAGDFRMVRQLLADTGDMLQSDLKAEYLAVCDSFNEADNSPHSWAREGAANSSTVCNSSSPTKAERVDADLLSSSTLQWESKLAVCVGAAAAVYAVYRGRGFAAAAGRRAKQAAASALTFMIGSDT
jgi:hypothetical protein